MTTGDGLFVTVGGRDIGLADLLRRVEKEMTQNADQAVRLGQSYARLATAQGRPALASQVLAGTMQRAGSASERALIGIQTQAARTNTGLAVLPRTIAGLSHEAASFATGMLGIGTALSVAKAGIDSFAEAFKFKADLDASASSLKSALTGFRDVSATTAEAAQFGRQFNITQEQTNSILSSSIDILKQSSGSVTQLETALLRLQTRDVSKPISEAARAMRELQAGDVTSIKELFNVPAKDALAMKNAIAAGGDSVQVLTAWLDKAGVGMDALAQRTQGAAGKMHELAVAQEDLKLAQAEFAQGPGLVILQGQIQATTGLTRVFTGDVNAMGQSLQNNAVALAANAAAYQAYKQALASGKTEAEANAIAVEAQANATAFLTGAQRDGGGGAFELAAATNTLTTAAVDSTAAQLANASSMELSGIQARAAAVAAEQKGSADRVAAVDAQTHQLAEQALAQQAQAAAQALLNAGASGANAAAQLANSSSSVDVLTAAYYRLAAAQAAADQAKTNAQAFTDQRAGERDAGSARTAAQITFAADQDRKAQASRLRRAEEAERALKKVRGGGGGGAAVKLTDQQKLENQLLTSQEQFSTKSEDAERTHLNRILDINADFAERMKNAQESFAQSQLEGRAGFYNSLGSIEDAGLRSALSAQYEAAFAEADKIAQERGADVGEKFLAAKQAAIEAQAKRASEIAEAQKAGDKDKAEYLAGVDRLYREAEERKLKAITEGQDSLAAQRDKQIADEAGQYAASQDKIGAAADTAAERKILAAERAGKAIDAEAIKVDGLANKYNGLGAAGARAGITPGPAAAPSTAPVAQTPAQTATGPAAEGPTLSDLITGLMGKIEDLKSALVGAEKSGADQVSGAVRSLGNSLVR